MGLFPTRLPSYREAVVVVVVEELGTDFCFQEDRCSLEMGNARPRISHTEWSLQSLAGGCFDTQPHLILPTTSWDRCCPHFADLQTEAQSYKMTLTRSSS